METEPPQSGFGQPIVVTFKNDVASVQMRRGENRLNLDFIKTMHQALDKVVSNDDAKVLVLTGEDKFFSNGIDLNWIGYHVMKDNKTLLNLIALEIHKLFIRILTFPLLTVAAINGHAYAGGVFLAMVCDYRVMSAERGWLCLNEVHINLLFDDFLKLLLRRLLHGNQFHRAVAMGERYTGDEALRAGLVHGAVAKERLLQAAEELAKVHLPKGGFNRKSLQNMKEQCYDDVISQGHVTNQNEPQQSGLGQPITVAFEDDVALVRMRRGENRINLDFVEAMNNALDEVIRNEDVKMMVLTGDGKFFSNGIDLNWISYHRKNKNMDIQNRFLFETNNMLARLLTLPVLTVAACNGHTYAGGVFLAMACDYRVMNSERGWYCLNEVHINLLFDDFKKLFLRRVLGGRLYHSAVVMGERYTASQAHTAGLLHATAPKKDVLKASVELGRKYLPKSGFIRDSLRKMKEQCYDDVLARRNCLPANI